MSYTEIYQTRHSSTRDRDIGLPHARQRAGIIDQPSDRLLEACHPVQVHQALLEKTSLGVIVDQCQRPALGFTRLPGASQPAQEFASGRAQVVELSKG